MVLAAGSGAGEGAGAGDGVGAGAGWAQPLNTRADTNINIAKITNIFFIFPSNYLDQDIKLEYAPNQSVNTFWF